MFAMTKISQSPDIFVVFLFLKEKTGTFIVLQSYCLRYFASPAL